MNVILTETTDIEQHRQKFPALANKAYFNFGGQGPMPQSAIDAIYQSYQDIQSAGPFSEAASDWILQEANEVRSAIASELSVAPETITIAENVTFGCNIALWGINWQSGDRILISDCEHPGVLATVGEIQRRCGVEVDTCNLLDTLNEGDPVAAIAKHLKPRTKLVVLSHVLWNTGQVLPLTEIVRVCKDNSPETRVLVDAAQSVGMLPLKLGEIGVDFYAFTGHKWLCGPEGIGGFYVRPDALESLSPTFIGWRSKTYSKEGITWQPDGRRFEIATSAYPLYAGLKNAIATHQAIGSQEQRYQQICHLSKYLWEQLSQISQITCLRTSPPESGLVSFQVSGVSHRELVLNLEKQGFLIRTIYKPNCVRACVHYFTLPSEIDRLVAAIQNLQFNT